MTALSVEDVIGHVVAVHRPDLDGLCVCDRPPGVRCTTRHVGAAVVAAIRGATVEQQADLLGGWIEAGLRWNDDIGESRNVARVVGPWRAEP